MLQTGVQPPLHRAARPPDHLRDLLEREIAAVAERERLALLLAHRVQRRHDQLAQLRGRDRGHDVRPEHLAAERDVDFQHFDAEGGGGQAGVDGARVVRKTDGATVALAEVWDQVEPDRADRLEDLRDIGWRDE